jgi:proliferating cell nuclear antigen
MLVKLENPKFFSEVISIISELVTEVKIRFDDFGMSIVAVDPANVSMVYFKLPKESFSEYKVQKETIGLNLDNLKAVLRRTKSSSSLIMESEDNMFNIKIIDKVKRNFSIAMIEIESEDKKIPSLEFMSQIQLSPSEFSEIIEDCLVVSDSCLFIAEPEKFIVEASGLNSARVEFSSDEVKIISGNSKARYSLEYLQKFMKAGRISEKVVVNFSTNEPIKLDFRNENFEFSFILAPRVENDD